MSGFTSFLTSETASAAKSIQKKIRLREASGERVWDDCDQYGNSTYIGDAWKDFSEFEDLFLGDVGSFLASYYETHFKILYGTLYRSEQFESSRKGSQVWHSDAGPGTCINIMFYLQDTTPEDGPLEVLPWDSSLALFKREKTLFRKGMLDDYGNSKRERISNWYDERIKNGEASEVCQPFGAAGLVVPFLNNTLHRGGYPVSGRKRTAIVFHVYPSHRLTDLSRYKVVGITKNRPYPTDPAEEF